MNEQTIFQAALELGDNERAAYLDQACAGNTELRQRVEQLLEAHARSGDFLDVPAIVQLANRTNADQDNPAQTSGVAQPAEDDVSPLTFLEPSTKPGSLGRLGHYEVLEVLGQGGFGTVVKAFDEKLHRLVAIKVMAPQLAATSPPRKRFLREARAAAAVRHENVVAIHAVEEQPIPYLVMEYVAGKTLQEKLDATGPLEVSEVLRIAQQIASGLAAAHATGLIHRDIKPGNVLLESGSDRVKITDFGLARTADDASLTQSGAIAGTPLYMAPEQALGEPLDQRADLFSLGSVLYVMCSGRPPFRAATTLAVLKRVAEDAPRPIREIIPEVPEWLCAIIGKLHAKKPAERFGSAKEVADVLGRCLLELQQRGRVETLGNIAPMTAQHAAPASEPEQKPAAQAKDSIRRPQRRWVAAAAAILAVLAGLAFTEAAGVTNFRGTVIRLFSPDGTLVVEVDDPDVSVSIDGEDMVISGAGAKEIRLKPGQYKVLASRDGKLVRQELVTVTRNGRQVVRVSKETEPGALKATTAAVDRRPQFRTGGDWRIEGNELVQANPGNARILFGDPNWTDYDFEVEVNSQGKTKDGHGSGVIYRATDLANHHDLEIGGWSATVTEAVYFKNGKWGRVPSTFLKVPHEHNRWYKAKVEVRGTKIRCSVDGKEIFVFEDADLPKGMIGLATGNSPVRWRNLKVTAPDGKILWQGFPEFGTSDSPNPPRYKNSLGMEFGLVPKGKAWLGGGGKLGEREWELQDDFYLGVYEVTQEEWEKVTGKNPSAFARGGEAGEKVKDIADADLKRFPVENVSWDDAQAFLKKLNEQAKDTGWVYRLPMAAEWEYACRGGPGQQKNAYGFDFYFDQPTNVPSRDRANFELVLKRTRTVGAYPANRLGLHDMHGNVWEWCGDTVIAGKQTEQRLLHGGGWGYGADGARAASRYIHERGSIRDNSTGLRVARVRIGTSATFTNSLGMEFALVPKGKAWLGGGGGGKAGDKEVEFKEDYYLAVYEVTQEEWQKVTGSNPSTFTRANGLRDVKDVSDEDIKRFPVEGMTWKDAHAFVARLNILCNEPGWVYRLPTEAEWEYACRGGPATDHLEGAFHFYLDKPANTLQPGQANYWPNPGTPLKRTTRVGSYAPNRLGLHDMHGNVWEFCQDEITTPGKPGISHVQRGGCWRDPLPTASSRHVDGSNWQNFTLGLRVARVRADNPPRFKNSIGMEFALVPKGKAWLGGGEGKPGDKEVEFKEDFYLGVYEVTQEEWEKGTGLTPSWFSRTGPGKDKVKEVSDAELKRFPVEMVSWNDAQLFLERLNKQEKEAGWIYRLPTEAEWEYACRGGPMSDKLESAFHWYSGKPTNKLLPEQANFSHERSLNRTCKVGSYQPNRLGLYDMHGNVMEWCDDGAKFEGKEDALRVISCGGWGDVAGRCYATFRLPAGPGLREAHLGLRVARVRVSTTDADRRAAEWVLSIGGGIQINESPQGIIKLADLPARPFELTGVWLPANNKATDEDMVNFGGCKNIRILHLGFTLVGDAGLANFKNCKKLTALYLVGPNITNDGLKNFKDCEDLEFLSFYGLKISGAGFAHLKDCSKLTTLELHNMQLDATGLAHLNNRKHLKILNLAGTWIRDADLVSFNNCPNLAYVGLAQTKVGNAGLLNFTQCKKLETIDLTETQVTDEGLDHLKNLGTLRWIVAKQAKVTAAGVKNLHEALPQCKIDWDGGTIEPKVAADPDRRAAEWVLSIGGGIKVDGGPTLLKTKEDLPREPFRLTTVGLPWNQKTTDKGWANLEGCQHVTMIELPYTPVTDAGIAYFKDCKGLVHLNLVDSMVTDVGLAVFKDRPELETLHIWNNRVTDAAMEFFKDSKKLRVLDIRCPKVTDAGMAYFKGRDLERLELTRSAVTDRGLGYFKDCVNLTWLDVSNTQISDDGLAHFKGCKKLGTLYAFGTELTDAALVHLKGCRNLSMLELDRTRVTGSGLGNLQDCNLTLLSLTGTPFSDQHIELLGGLFRLKTVRLKGTKVTEAGVKKLAALLPHCNIDWNGGVIEPTKASVAPDRRAGEWVLLDRGPRHRSHLHLLVGEKLVQFSTGDKLPEGPFEVRQLSISGLGKDDSSVALEHLTKLASPDLRIYHSPGIGDAELAALAGHPSCQKLKVLVLNTVGVTQTGLPHIAKFTKLDTLILGLTPVSAKELALYRGLPITDLNMFISKNVNDAAIAELADYPSLKRLSLAELPLTDSALEHLAKCKTLQSLTFARINFSEAARKKLTAALPDCKIAWDSNVEPTSPTPDGASTPARDYDKLATGRWQPVLTAPGDSVARRNAAFSDGLIEIQDGHAYDTSVQAADLIVRAKVQKLSGQNVMLTLRDVKGVYYSAFYQCDGSEAFGIGMRGVRFNYAVKQRFEASAGVKEGEFFELAFAAMGDTLTVYANGKRVGEIRDAAITQAGGVAVHVTKGKGVFKDVEIMVLDKAP